MASKKLVTFVIKGLAYKVPVDLEDIKKIREDRSFLTGFSKLIKQQVEAGFWKPIGPERREIVNEEAGPSGVEEAWPIGVEEAWPIGMDGVKARPVTMDDFKAWSREVAARRLIRQKEKDLWNKIAEKMGCPDITGPMAERKFRSLRQRYRIEKDRMKTSGSGAVQWPWYEAFEDLYRRDVTVDPSNIIKAEIGDRRVPRRRKEDEERPRRRSKRRRINDEEFNFQYLEILRQSEANRKEAETEAETNRREQAERTIKLFERMVQSYEELVKLSTNNNK